MISHSIRESAREVASSRLGRRIIYVLALAVTVPLLLFAIPMYTHTRSAAIEETDRALKDYARHCSRHIVQTLFVAKAQLATISRGGRIPAGENYFLELYEIAPGARNYPAWLPREAVKAIAGSRDVFLAPFFPIAMGSGGRDVTTGMAMSRADGSLVAAVLNPTYLWQTLAVSARARDNGYFILDSKGAPIVSGTGNEMEALSPAPLLPLDPNLPRQAGVSDLPGIGEARWAFDRLWLRGMFLADELGIVAYRREASVIELPRQLAVTLVFLALVSFGAALVVSLRTASYLYTPIARLTHEAERLGKGEWDAVVHLDRDDELGTLAKTFNDMAANLQASHGELEELNRTLEQKVHDRTEMLNQARKKAEYDALHDRLSGLPNRAVLGESIERLIRRCGREHRLRFAILFIDLDRFKSINDSLGHAAGDQIIREMAARITSSIRPGDIAVRVSGDEFAVLLDPVESEREALGVADRLHGSLAPPFEIMGTIFHGSFSIGIALGSWRTSSAEEILKEADAAMYQAKSAGRGRTRVFDLSLRESMVDRLKLETELRRAAEAHRFTLDYQPIVELGSGRLAGFEAALSWRDGLITDRAVFIPAADDAGLAATLGAFLLREACRWFGERLRQAPPGSHFSTRAFLCVPLSPRQFNQPELAAKVRAILEESGMAPSALTISIREEALRTRGASQEMNAAVLHDLAEAGIRVDIENFGVGSASFGALAALKVSRVKLDRSLVTGLGSEDRRGLAVCRALVTLASSLGFETIADGIETERQANLLKSVGCPMGQGSFFALHLSPESAASLTQSGEPWFVHSPESLRELRLV